METTKSEQQWERTNVTNLLRNRQSGKYYARVKVNGKQKWRTLKTAVFSVAKLRLAEVEKIMRSQAAAAKGESAQGAVSETTVERFITAFRVRIANNSKLAASSKARTLDSVKTLIKTWPELPGRDVRRLTASDCNAWAVAALREGTGFIAPNVKTKRKGMSPSSFNKCVDTLRTILEIAHDQGMVYQNPAKEVSKAPKRQKRLELPSAAQFKAIVKKITTAGSHWSTDAADLVRLLAYSGARLREATSLRWRHEDKAKGQLTIPGSKSATSYRIVPLFPSLLALLGEIRKRRGPEAKDAPIAHIASCMDALKSACREIGIKPMNHHDLRHLFATRCIESGVDIPTVSRWLGHSDGGALAMQTYGHLRQEHSLAQAAKVVF
jgi:integrase